MAVRVSVQQKLASKYDVCWVGGALGGVRRGGVERAGWVWWGLGKECIGPVWELA